MHCKVPSKIKFPARADHILSRSILRPSVSQTVQSFDKGYLMQPPQAETALTGISQRFASQMARKLTDSSTLSLVLATSPQTVTQPIWFQTHNLRPFDQPVYVASLIVAALTLIPLIQSASVVTFVGLIFLLILAFFIVVCLDLLVYPAPLFT